MDGIASDKEILGESDDGTDRNFANENDILGSNFNQRYIFLTACKFLIYLLNYQPLNLVFLSFPFLHPLAWHFYYT